VQENGEPLRFVTSRNSYLHGEVYNLNNRIYWVIPVGVAAGLSLPLLVPTKKTPKPVAPPPPMPVVSVEGFELKPKSRPVAPVDVVSAVQPTAEPAVSDAAEDYATLASQPMQVTPVLGHRRRAHRHIPRLDSRTMRRLADEDSRAWQAADRLLQYERRGT